MGLENKRVINPVLTKLADGYKMEGLIGTEIFQEVSVDKMGGQIPRHGKQAFRDYATERAIRASSNRRNQDEVNHIDFVCKEHDIETPIDYLEQSESMENERKNAMEDNKEILELDKEREIAAIVTDETLYPAGHAVQLSGTDQIDNAASDPAKLFSDAIEKVRIATGSRPKFGWMSADVYAKMKLNPSIKATLSNDSLRVPKVSDLETIFDLQKIYVADSVSAAGAADTLSDVWSKTMGVFHKVTSNSPKKRNFGYTLKLKKGSFVDSYPENGGKITVERATDNYIPKQVGADSAFLYYDAIA